MLSCAPQCDPRVCVSIAVGSNHVLPPTELRESSTAAGLPTSEPGSSALGSHAHPGATPTRSHALTPILSGHAPSERPCLPQDLALPWATLIQSTLPTSSLGSSLGDPGTPLSFCAQAPLSVFDLLGSPGGQHCDCSAEVWLQKVGPPWP